MPVAHSVNMRGPRRRGDLTAPPKAGHHGCCLFGAEAADDNHLSHGGIGIGFDEPPLARGLLRRRAVERAPRTCPWAWRTGGRPQARPGRKSGPGSRFPPPKPPATRSCATRRPRSYRPRKLRGSRGAMRVFRISPPVTAPEGPSSRASRTASPSSTQRPAASWA